LLPKRSFFALSPTLRALLLISTAGTASSRPSRQAATTACMLLPLWEAKKPSRMLGI